MAKKMLAAKANPIPAEVEEVLANMDLPQVISIGDWACPYGHFNNSVVWACARCQKENK